MDAVHCSSLLRLCASSSGWCEALGLLSSAEGRGVQMDAVAWNAMMSATKAGKGKEAVEGYERQSLLFS